LRQGEFSSDSIGAQQEPTDSEDQQRIDQNPTDAAHHYLRLLKATKKEFKIMTNNRDKIEQKYEELKEKFDELKQESRKDVEEIMNMETKIFDLNAQNQRLQSELEKAKGNYKTEEEIVRKEVEDYFKERLAYKDSEIEQMT
jgi:predicted nuclease with TOPRIM domain